MDVLEDRKVKKGKKSCVKYVKKKNTPSMEDETMIAMVVQVRLDHITSSELKPHGGQT